VPPPRWRALACCGSKANPNIPLDMALPAVFESSFELMIFLWCRQRFTEHKAIDNLLQLGHVFAAFDQEFNIFFECGFSNPGPLGQVRENWLCPWKWEGSKFEARNSDFGFSLSWPWKSCPLGLDQSRALWTRIFTAGQAIAQGISGSRKADDRSRTRLVQAGRWMARTSSSVRRWTTLAGKEFPQLLVLVHGVLMMPEHHRTHPSSLHVITNCFSEESGNILMRLAREFLQVAPRRGVVSHRPLEHKRRVAFLAEF
jgi:hypothetical protein